MKPTSIVWISARRIVRADFKAGRDGAVLVRLDEAPRPQTEDLGTLVDAALRLSKSKCKRVWVLTQEVVATVLGVPHDVAQELPEVDLQQTLAFEAETVTGVSAFESVLGFVSLPSTLDERRFWIAQLTRQARDRIADAAKNYGAKLVGITHPAGVWQQLVDEQHSAQWQAPRQQPADTGTGWRRCEQWDDLTLAVTSRAGQADWEVLGSGGSLRRSFAVNLGRESDHSEWLIDDPNAVAEATTINLADQAALQRWLTAWASELGRAEARPRNKGERRANTVSLIRPDPQPMSSGQRSAIALSLAVAVLLVCVGLNVVNRVKLKSLAGELEALQAPGKALAEIEKDIAAETKKKTELSAKVDAATRDIDVLRGTVERQRLRSARLLELLAAHTQSDVIVQEIAATNGETRVLGLCLQTESVQLLSQRLGEGLAASGLDVLPAELTGLSQRTDGGPWKFAIVIRDKVKG